MGWAWLKGSLVMWLSCDPATDLVCLKRMTSESLWCLSSWGSGMLDQGWRWKPSLSSPYLPSWCQRLFILIKKTFWLSDCHTYLFPWCSGTGWARPPLGLRTGWETCLGRRCGAASPRPSTRESGIPQPPAGVCRATLGSSGSLSNPD